MRGNDDLSHVPRRAVGMAKDLRRMGLRVVTRAGMFLEGEDEMSSSDVKVVTDAARAVTEVGRRAREIADSMRASIGEVNDALDVADVVSKTLRSAAAELRGALGVQTNSPPKDEDTS